MPPLSIWGASSQHLGCHLSASGVPPLSIWGSSSQHLGCLLSAPGVPPLSTWGATSQHLGCLLSAPGVPPLSTWGATSQHLGASSQHLGCLLSASSHYSHTKHTSVPLAKLVSSAHVDYDKQMQFTLLTCRGQQHLQVPKWKYSE